MFLYDFHNLVKSLPNRKNMAMGRPGALKMEIRGAQNGPQGAKMIPGSSKMKPKSDKIGP